MTKPTMTPLNVDKYIRCVKSKDKEEWYAYSTLIQNWFKIDAKLAAWIFGMVPAFEINIAMAHCRENCYARVDDEFSFDK